MTRLEGKVAIITGGAGGMGASHAKRFIEEGAKVVIADLASSNAEDFTKELGENAMFVAADVTNEASWESLVATTIEKFGKVDILVNNAGISTASIIEETTLESFQKVVLINQVGVFLGMKHVVPHMKENKSGSIINISSISGLRGTKGGVSYGASKFAVTGMTKSVALEVAEFGVRVNSVHPGVIKTKMTDPAFIGEEAAKTIQPFIDKIPVKRMAEPEEVTNLVLYLASDESSYSNGAEFVVDGGSTAQ
ncbi:SDR family oxidoreductase [Lysinibacillus yapensis]|uniref:SDR family oxidoreductase n=1 Tax=Ureibacillus yapensis TaxID=2304605 RepID=A0A396SG14_9BACL|nr:glucose 1-dehydrogenase [Lysinibacillus yapensis]RHW37406.1 SDR family oxidoreductase [Lysinibacillus yapensis]